MQVQGSQDQPGEALVWEDALESRLFRERHNMQSVTMTKQIPIPFRGGSKRVPFAV